MSYYGYQRDYFALNVEKEKRGLKMNYCSNKDLRKLEEAKAFLGRLLGDSLEATCTDFQHDYVEYFIEILGVENVPECLKNPSDEE